MKTKNKKLRLLITTKCPNKCPMCCNNQFDFNKIPVVDRWDYDEISITGGEPLLVNDYELYKLIHSIRTIRNAEGQKITMFLYTACFDVSKLLAAMQMFEGIVLTPHKPKDIEDFVKLNDYILRNINWASGVRKCSLRLNLFADMKTLLPKGINLYLWKVKDMEWIENCPVPEGEDFRRIANLF